MAVQILYPSSPDDGFSSWSVYSSNFDRYDAINEGTDNPDAGDYITRTVVGNAFFDDLYENGSGFDNVLAYNQKVRVNLGELDVIPDSGGIELNIYAASQDNQYYDGSAWGIGSFYSEHDYLLEYWDLDETSGIRVSSVPIGGHALSVGFSEGVPSYDTGILGNAVSFSSTDKTFLFSSLSTIARERYAFNSPKSFGGWIKNNTPTGDALIFAIGDGSLLNSCATLKLLDGGSMEFAIYWRYTNPDTGELAGRKLASVTTVAPTVDEWTFVMCVFDLQTRKIKISVNAGAFVETSYSNTVVNSDFDSLYMGGIPNVISSIDSANVTESYFNGLVDEWGIWDIDFSLSDLATLYNSGSGKTYPLPNITDRKFTTLYDKDGLEIASVKQTSAASSGDLIQINGTTPTLYTLKLDAIDEQQPVWDNYDLSNVYLDLQLFVEKQYVGTKVVGQGYNITTNAGSNGVGDNDGFGSFDWDWPDNIETLSTGVYTIGQFGTIVQNPFITGTGTKNTNYLTAQDFDFSFDSGTNFRGIEVEAHMIVTSDPGMGSAPEDTVTVTISCELLDDTGTVVGSPRYFVIEQNSGWQDIVAGGPMDNFGYSLTDSVVNSANFGVRIRGTVEFPATSNTFTVTIQIDHVRMRVTALEPVVISPNMTPTIFTMDVELDGEAVESNNFTLFINGPTQETDNIPLYIEPPADMNDNTTLYIHPPIQDTGDTTLYIDGVDPQPTGDDIPLYTIGGLYDSDSIDLFILNTTEPADCTLYILGTIDDSGEIPLSITGKIFQSDNTTLYIDGVITQDDNNNMPLYTKGFGDQVTDSNSLFVWSANNTGFRDIASMYLKADNSGERSGTMPLYIQSPDMADGTSNMPLYLENHPASIYDSTTLFMNNNAIQDSGNTNLFISAPGTTDGAFPENDNMPLYIERDQVHSWKYTTMFIKVASGDEADTTMFITSIADDNASTNLSVPNVTNPESGENTLYINGF